METPVAGTNSYSISKRFADSFVNADELQLWCGTPASGRLVAKVAGLNAGAAGTYTHSVPSSDATLSALNLNLADTDATAVAISPAFASGTTAYTASVFADRVKVSPTPNDAGASYVVSIGDDAFDGGLVLLDAGDNAVTVVVTAADGATTKTYTVTVTRLEEVWSATVTAGVLGTLLNALSGYF